MHPEVQRRLDLLEEEIRNSVEEPSSLNIEETVMYSFRHANRLFKAAKGESIQAYSAKVRLQTAAEYVKYSDQPLAEIATWVGYSSTAAFSKAFRKLYGKPPSALRESVALDHGDMAAGELPYAVIHLDIPSVQVAKVTTPTEGSIEAFYTTAVRALRQLTKEQQEFLLLWDEDPNLCQLNEVRFFVGIQNALNQAPIIQSKRSIQGKYAVFQASEMTAFDYQEWHEQICLFLTLAGWRLRDAPYLEWFDHAALQSAQTFHPKRMGVAIG